MSSRLDEYYAHHGAMKTVKAPEAERAPGKLVGLMNQGATCYLNSLIQALYMTPELRQGLFCLDPHEHLAVQNVQEYEQQLEKEKAGGQFADEGMLDQLKGMGLNEHGAQRALIGVKNSSVETAMDFYWQNSEKPGFLDPPPAKKKLGKKPRLIPLELQRLFTQLQFLNQRAVSTEALTSKGFQWKSYDGRVQHDAHELNRKIIDAMEKSLKNTPGEELCSKLYRGELLNQRKCTNCTTSSDSIDPFYDLNVLVQDQEDLVQALRVYFAPEVLEDFKCDLCQAKGATQKTTSLRQVPPILAFSCNRFKCDRTTSFRDVKIVDKYAFPLILDMGRFVEGAAPQGQDGAELAAAWLSDVEGICTELASRIVAQRGEGVKLDDVSREDLVAMLELSSSSSSSTTDAAAAAVEGARVRVDPAIFGGVRGYCPEPLVPPASASASSEQRYELFAVINHRGNAQSGHYFAYIRDCLGEGQWALPSAAGDGDKDNGGILSSDPKKCGFMKLPPLSGKDRYIVDAEHPLGMVIKALQSVGRADSPNRVALRLDELLKYLQRTAESSTPAALQLLDRKGKGGLLDVVKTHPEFLELQGQNVVTHDAVLDVLIATEFSSRCAAAAAAAVAASAVSSSAGAPPPAAPAGDAADLDLAAYEGLQMAVAADAGAQGDEGEWESAATTKKGKKGKKGAASLPSPVPQPPASSSSSAATSAAPTSSTPPASPAVAALANELAARFFGNFYEFDDSSVAPMTLGGVSKAFVGRDTAYLLIYRRVGLDPPRSSLPQPPAHWQQEVEELNKQLDEERAGYEKKRHTLTLNIYAEDQMRVSGPLLFPRPFTCAPDHVQHKMVLQLDGRQTVEEAMKVIMNEWMRHLGGEFPLRGSTVELSNLQRYGAGFFCLPTLARNAVLEEVVGREMTVLLWNGATIDDNVVPIGDASECGLLQFSVSLLQPPPEAESDGGGWRPQVSLLSDELWVSASKSVAELCLGALALSGLDPSSSAIHVVEPTGSFDGRNAATLLLSRGVLAVGKDKDNCAVDLRGTTLLVEALPALADDATTNEPAASSLSTLAEKHVSRLNLVWTVRIELDCDGVGEALPPVPPALLHQPSPSPDAAAGLGDLGELPFCVETLPGASTTAGADGNGSNGSSGGRATITLEVEHTSTLAALKVRALEALGWLNHAQFPEAASKTCLATGEFPARWALDETKTLGESGSSSVCNNCTIVLTVFSDSLLVKPAACASTKLTLTVWLVTDNDRAHAFNPRQPGLRRPESKRIEVLATETVTGLRDRLGVELLGLPAGWTQSGGGPAHGLRLREVNAQHESKQLLSELPPIPSGTTAAGAAGGPRAPSKDARRGVGGSFAPTLRKLKVSSGALLHLEEGFTQYEGMSTYHLLLWSPRPHEAVDTGFPALGLPSTTAAGGPVDGETTNASEAAAAAAVAPDALDEARRIARRHLLPFGALDAHDDSSLADLYHRAHALLVQPATREALLAMFPTFSASSSEGSATAVSLPQSPDHMVMRDVRADLLPGASFWMLEPAVQRNNALASIASIGSGAVKGSRTLKQGIIKPTLHGGQKVLVVEVLDKKQSDARAALGPTGSFRVWALRLKTAASSASDGDARFSQLEGAGGGQGSAWPPLQITVAGGTMPNMNHLKRPLSSAFGFGDALDAVRVFRFNHLPAKQEWYELSSKLKPSFGKKKENITEPPFSLAEGDLVCALQASTLPPLAHGERERDVVVLRAEDDCLKRRTELQRELKRKGGDKKNGKASSTNGKSGGGGGGGGAALNIGGDLDFEDEGDEDGGDEDEED